jgi:hypothetical protein
MPLINNRLWVCIVIFLLLLSFGNVQAQDWEENDRSVGLEFLGATAGELLIGISSGALATGVAMSIFNVDGDVGPGFVFLGVGYIVGTSVGAPLGTILTAKIVQAEGSVFGAYVGGIMGTGLGGLSAIYLQGDVPDKVLVASMLLLPPLCSVIGYNLHKSGNDFNSSIPKNFPEMEFTVLPEKYDNKISPKIGAKVTVRF